MRENVKSLEYDNMAVETNCEKEWYVSRGPSIGK